MGLCLNCMTLYGPSLGIAKYHKDLLTALLSHNRDVWTEKQGRKTETEEKHCTLSTHRNLTPPKGFSGSLPSSLAAPSAAAVVEAVIFGTTDTLFSCLDLKKEELN